MKEALTRIYAVTGARTQLQLAEVLDSKQSSVSFAKRRGSIPDAWLITLLRRYSINPEWILTGQGAKYLAPAPDDDLETIEGFEAATIRQAVTHFGVFPLLHQLETTASRLADAAVDFRAGKKGGLENFVAQIGDLSLALACTTVIAGNGAVKCAKEKSMQRLRADMDMAER